MYNYRPPISDEEIDYLITYGTKEEIDEANERIISDMDDYCEYLVRMEEEKDPLKRLDILFEQILKDLSK